MTTQSAILPSASAGHPPPHDHLKGHTCLADMLAGHLIHLREALQNQRAHAPTDADRSFFDHELTALTDLEVATRVELAAQAWHQTQDEAVSSPKSGATALAKIQDKQGKLATALRYQAYKLLEQADLIDSFSPLTSASDEALAGELRRRGLQPVVWSVDALDSVLLDDEDAVELGDAPYHALRDAFWACVKDSITEEQAEAGDAHLRATWATVRETLLQKVMAESPSAASRPT